MVYIGLKTYSMSAQNNIDRIILGIFGTNKIFVEAGGSHPVDQNNTFLLEKNGWSGLIVEPKTDFNTLYSSLRPKSIVENFVLVSNDYSSDEIYGDFSHYMVGGVINNNLSSSWVPKKHKCTTLDLLLKKHKFNEIHFISLDVEGYEKEVIDGINFDDVFIHSIVVENHNFNDRDSDFSILKKIGFDDVLTIGNNHHVLYINKKSIYYDK